jgi:hypothetical protein
MLPRPGSANAPQFWRYETGGELRIAVENYLNDRAMSLRQIALMRAYLRQWIASPVWDLNPSHDWESRQQLQHLREDVDGIVTPDHIHKWIGKGLDIGIDPL